jgi:hypothetical protein
VKKPAPLLRRKALSRSKYGNKRTPVGDRMFDSKGEAGRAMELRLMEKGGLIRGLRFQVTFPLVVNGMEVGRYRSDFCYTDAATGKDVVEDFKSPATRTQLYLLKKKLMLAIHNIDVFESYAGGKGRAAVARRR